MISRYGLIGFPLGHSFSAALFRRKWAAERVFNCSYDLMPLEDIRQLPQFIAVNPLLKGFNVTIPHKKTILPLLDHLSPEAAAVGAVNTVKIITRNNTTVLLGFNTDVAGVRVSLNAFQRKPDGALVFGTGGGSAAVRFVLNQMQIPYEVVSREPAADAIAYEQVDREVLRRYPLLINCTPVGTSGFDHRLLPLPYQLIADHNQLFDLVYNPAVTPFLKHGLSNGAACMNGYRMLEGQAAEAWRIWTDVVV